MSTIQSTRQRKKAKNKTDVKMVRATIQVLEKPWNLMLDYSLNFMSKNQHGLCVKFTQKV